MTYEKPEVIAQNAAAGSYAAGCPANTTWTSSVCKECERTEQYVCVSSVQYGCPSGKYTAYAAGQGIVLPQF